MRGGSCAGRLRRRVARSVPPAVANSRGNSTGRPTSTRRLRAVKPGARTHCARPPPSLRGRGGVVASAPMKEKLAIFNAFVHDVATGTWISTLILLTLVHREAASAPWAAAAHLVPGLERKFLVLTWLSLGVILATGAVRMVT